MRRPLLFLGLFLSATGCADAVTDLVAYGTIEVIAERRSGEPVPGVELYLYNPYQVHSHGFTDEHGRLLFERVPAFRYGVFARPPEGYAWIEGVLGLPESPYVQNIFLEHAQHDSVSYTFAKIGPGRVEVSVTEPDGAPVEEGRIVLYSPEETLAEENLGAGGRVVFDPVSFGNRGVWVRPTAYYLDEGERGPFKAGMLIEDGHTEVVEFVLEPCLGTLRGRAVDENGDPASGVTVQLYRPTEVVDEKTTGASGEVAFPTLRCRNFGLSLGYSPGWSFETGRGRSFFDGLFVHRGSDEIYTFEVDRIIGTVRIRIQFPDGTPVAGASVLLYISRGPWAEGITGVEGWHDFLDVPGGQEYGLMVLPGEGYTVVQGRGTSFVDGIVVEDDGVVSRTLVVQSPGPTPRPRDP